MKRLLWVLTLFGFIILTNVTIAQYPPMDTGNKTDDELKVSVMEQFANVDDVNTIQTDLQKLIDNPNPPKIQVTIDELICIYLSGYTDGLASERVSIKGPPESTNVKRMSDNKTIQDNIAFKVMMMSRLNNKDTKHLTLAYNHTNDRP